ncbi:fibrinogen-like protein 1-like protein [Heterodontus francisci]|uniref:fibrinogen-like protein 1-like protein n=1 Tax=Heterodontus francisci TaxID=7792 RepID=UPI00355B4565
MACDNLNPDLLYKSKQRTLYLISCLTFSQQDSQFSIMNFHKQLLAFAVILLSAQSFTLAAEGILTYKQMELKVANADMITEHQMDKIINLRDLLLKRAYSKDCAELFAQGSKDSGLYVIQPKGSRIIVVNCKMNYDCDGWTVLHRNTRGSEMIWNETWTTYKYGFGNAEGDHYFGNEYMYFITNQKWYKARIILEEEKHGEIRKSYAEYDIFRLGNEGTNYTLRLGTYKGGAGDALASNDNMVDNMPFSTRDSGHGDCASKYGGGWWFNSCSTENPFAMLTQTENIHWKPYCTNCKHATLMVKPVNMFCRSENMKLYMPY